MVAIIKRNILIYFRKFSNIMFSLVRINDFLFIYILSLRKNILSSLHQITAAGKVLRYVDAWGVVNDYCNDDCVKCNGPIGNG